MIYFFMSRFGPSVGQQAAANLRAITPRGCSKDDPLWGKEKDSSGLGVEHPFGLWISIDHTEDFMVHGILRCFELKQSPGIVKQAVCCRESAFVLSIDDVQTRPRRRSRHPAQDIEL